MRSYVPNTVEERREMLKTLGLSEMDELFADIPADLQFSHLDTRDDYYLALRLLHCI